MNSRDTSSIDPFGTERGAASVGAEGAKHALAAFSTEFDVRLSEKIQGMSASAPGALADAVRYSLLAPGKRMRPFLVVGSCKAVGGDLDLAWAPAFAVECVHAFSLVHDDLPSMDDDDWRRGCLTCHRKFGEAAAILAGDALLALAFEFLAGGSASLDARIRMVQELAVGAGWSGMIGGQHMDLEGETAPANQQLAYQISLRKTAALIRAACVLGGLAGGASTADLNRLSRYGEFLGIAFQIADDLLDVTSTREQMGKSVAKDTHFGKQTLARCVGVDGAMAQAQAAARDAAAALTGLGGAADDLLRLAEFAVFRNS